MKLEEEIGHKMVNLGQELELLKGLETPKHSLNPAWAQRDVLNAKIDTLRWVLQGSLL